jgi:transcriptional regulator with XRE-family HTH domain
MDGRLYGETFGARLHRLRRAKGLKQAELAAQIGCTGHSVSSWESERTQPQAKWLLLLSFALDVPVLSLRDGDGRQATPPRVVSGIRWEDQAAADVDLFRKMWNNGVVTRRMAKKLGVNPVTIHQVRKRLGLPPRKADISRSGGYAS